MLKRFRGGQPPALRAYDRVPQLKPATFFGSSPRAGHLWPPVRLPAWTLRQAPQTIACSLDGGKASGYSQQQGWVNSELGHEDSTQASTDPQAAPQQQQCQEGPSLGATHKAHQEKEGGSSWEEWVRTFGEMDNAAERQQQLVDELQLAVQFEEYGRAAAVKQQLDELQARDLVRKVQHDLQLALSEERYGDAARLRDQGMASLQGWWAGIADGDPTGHMLHIGPEFGRWTGRAYTASDLADLCGVRESGSPLMRLRTRGAIAREKELLSKKVAKSEIGSPAMEVFLKPGPNGSMLHQPVSLIGNMPLNSSAEALKDRPQLPNSPASGRYAQDPADSKEGEKRRKQAAKAMSSSLGPVVQLTVSIEADGSASIRAMPTPSPQPRSTFSDKAADEAAAAMRELSELSEPPASASTSDAKLAEEYWFDLGEEDRKAGEAEQERREEKDVPDPGAEGSSAPAAQEQKDSASSSQAGQAGVQAAQEGERGLGMHDQGPEGSSNSSSSSSSSSGSGRAEGNWGLIDMRGLGAKEIEAMVSRNIAHGGSAAETKSSSDGDRSTNEGGTASADNSNDSGSSSSGGNRERTEVREEEDEEEEDGEGSGPELSRLPAKLDMEGRDAFVLQIPRDGAKATAVPDSASSSTSSPMSSSGSESPLATFEVLIPARQFLGSSGSGNSTDASTSKEQEAAGLRGPISEALSKVATQLISMRAMQTSSSKITPEIMSEALRVVANRLTSGEATTLRISASGASFTILDPNLEQGKPGITSSGPRTGEEEEDEADIRRQVKEAVGVMDEEKGGKQDRAKSPGAQPQQQKEAGSIPIRYTRVLLDAPRTDPFSGLFIGSFGPHGPELLRIQRTVYEGEEAVVATKLTGDPNVPAGSPSFRVKVGRKYKLNARDVYPDELGVLGRYKGEGRVAQKGNVEPRWVDGELLVFAVGASPLTAGAELGFVFVVPGERRFLILLNKVDLTASLEKKAL